MRYVHLDSIVSIWAVASIISCGVEDPQVEAYSHDRGLESEAASHPRPLLSQNANSSSVIAYYPLEGNARDAVGDSHGQVFGTTTIEGVRGNGLAFDGNAYVALQKIHFKKTGAIPTMTTCAWIYTSKVGDNNRFGNFSIIDFDRSEYFSLFTNEITGAVMFATATKRADGKRDIHDLEGKTNIADGQWHQVCGVYDGADKIVYVDGVEDGRASSPHQGRALGTGVPRFGFLGDGSEATRANGRRNKFYFEGGIDDLWLWKRALTPSEVLARYEERDSPPQDTCEGARVMEPVSQLVTGRVPEIVTPGSQTQNSCLQTDASTRKAIHTFEVTERTHFYARFAERVANTPGALYLRKNQCGDIESEVVCSATQYRVYRYGRPVPSEGYFPPSISRDLDPGRYYLFVEPPQFNNVAPGAYNLLIKFNNQTIPGEHCLREPSDVLAYWSFSHSAGFQGCFEQPGESEVVGTPSIGAYGLTLDGDSYLKVQHSDRLDVDHTQPFSISAWMYLPRRPRNPGVTGVIIAKSDDIVSPESANAGWGLFTEEATPTQQRIIFRIRTSQGQQSEISVVAIPGRMTRIRASYDGTSNANGMSLYATDYTLWDEAHGTSAPFEGTIRNQVPLSIAAENDGQFALGKDIALSQIRIHSRALGRTELSTHSPQRNQRSGLDSSLRAAKPNVSQPKNW